VRIAVDAMGGDYAPAEIVKGVIDAAVESPDIEIILVGDEGAIKNAGTYKPAGNVTINHVTGVISFNDGAVTRSRENSISCCCDLVKEKKADAYISAGHTGACMASSVISWKKIAKIDRPAIPTPIPTPHGEVILIDAGANVDCKPLNLHQFAIMGSIYSERIFGKKNPRIGILSNGTEDKKGNKLSLETFLLLKSSKLNFVGNVEGSSIFKNVCDVIVCDGFVGNVMLKSIESTCEMIISMAKGIIGEAMCGKNTSEKASQEMPVFNVIENMRRRLDYAEYGGAPLLGVLGTCIISHGSSKARAIKNAIGLAKKFVAEGINEKIEQDIANSF